MNIMKKHPTLTVEKLQALFDREVVVCPFCGPVENVFAEIWSNNRHELFGIQFIHQGPENGATLVDHHELSQMADDEVVSLYFCSECHCSINDWIPVTWFDAEEILGSEFWQQAN